jgi:hypothetical protein
MESLGTEQGRSWKYQTERTAKTRLEERWKHAWDILVEGTHQRTPEDLVPQALALPADLPKTNPYWRDYYSIISKEEGIEGEGLSSNSFEG